MCVGVCFVQYVLPLMLTVMGARLMGNIYDEGQYDKHIQLRRLKYLEEEECLSHLSEMVHLTVNDIMTKNPVCMQTVVNVGELVECLETVKHNCFPIVDTQHGDILVGTVLRKVLCMLLKVRAFSKSNTYPNTPNASTNNLASAGNNSSSSSSSPRKYIGHMGVGDLWLSPLVCWGTLECVYPDFPDVNDLQLTDSDKYVCLCVCPREILILILCLRIGYPVGSVGWT
jgi:hypothetical protein